MGRSRRLPALGTMARARGLAPVALIALLLAPAVSGLAAPRPTLPRARPRDNVLPPLLRLRGGDSGALQKAQSMYFGVPLLTRSWLSAIVAIAGLNQVGILPPELLQIDATAVVKRWQFWRPFTAASFMGGLGPQLLQKCYYLVMFGKDLERTLGVAEYTRVLASCTALLCLVCAMLGWQFVGDGLIQAITVIMCQQHPDQPVSLYGLSIPCQYLPFAQLCMSYLFTQQIPWLDILGALVRPRAPRTPTPHRASARARATPPCRPRYTAVPPAPHATRSEPSRLTRARPRVTTCRHGRWATCTI